MNAGDMNDTHLHTMRIESHGETKFVNKLLKENSWKIN